jgi:hypothetical protein
VDNGSDSNDDGENDCSDTGLSDDSDSDVTMDGTFGIVGGVNGECDIKGNGDEGFGDEEDNIKCDDDDVDGNKCDDDDDDDDDDNDDDGDDDNDNDGGGGVNDDGNGEGGADDEICDDDICDAVAEECKDVRLLLVLKELLAVCSTSAISEDTGDNGLLLSEASELF